LLANWDRVVAAIRDDAPTWSAIFEHAVPLELGADRVRLSFASSARFAGQQASDREGSERLQKAVEKILGGRPDVQVEYSDQNASSSLVARSRAARDEHSESLRDEAMNHPRVKEARQLFPEVTSRYDVQVEDKRDRPEQGD